MSSLLPLIIQHGFNSLICNVSVNFGVKMMKLKRDCWISQVHNRKTSVLAMFLDTAPVTNCLSLLVFQCLHLNIRTSIYYVKLTLQDMD